MIVIFQYLKPGASAPEAITFSDTGYDFGDKQIPSIGDYVVLPFKDENGKDNFTMKKVISRRFWVDGPLGPHPVQDEITMVVTDSDDAPESFFQD